MNFEPLLTELAKPSPSRDIIIDELDIITDYLRAGFPTDNQIDDLFNLFTKLIHFAQWHIQQFTLSCTKYIFENSKLNTEQKIEVLLRHIDFTEHLGELLQSIKREVREMAAQCLGHLALHIGPSIIDEQFKIAPALFTPNQVPIALEGQQMALGRLAIAFRIESHESLSKILPYIINCESFKITNPSDNGYVYWYSTRSLLLFVTGQLDPVLKRYQTAFENSTEYIMTHFKDQIMECVLSRLNHPYVNVRRTAAKVVAQIFSTIQTDREQFIDSLLPKSDMKWIEREGFLAAIGGSLTMLKSPLDSAYIESLCQKLTDFVKDPIACDAKTPVTQKSNANGMAGKALVQVLRFHDQALYEKYVRPVVEYLLSASIAALIDAGVICMNELQQINNQKGEPFDLKSLYLKAFKNICHASFPIRDITRRTVPAAQLVQASFDELISTLVNFSTNADPEVRESVCKAIQMISNMAGTQKLPQIVTEMAENLTKDSNESVAASAIDVLRCALDEQAAKKVPPLVKEVLSNDGDEIICAAIRLLKASLVLYRNAVINDIYSIAPLLAFHTLASMSPAVSTNAQQLLIMIASDTQETDDEIVNELSEIDFDSIDVSELDETIEKCVSNAKAPSSILKVIVNKYCENYGSKSPREIIEELQNGEESSVEELIDYVCGQEKADIIAKLAMLLIKANDIPKDAVKKVLQVLADIFADETFDIEEKQPLLLALDEMRKLPSFAGDNRILIPDSTPISLSHHTETFAQGQLK